MGTKRKNDKSQQSSQRNPETESSPPHRRRIPEPPPLDHFYIIHGDQETLKHWLQHYWPKLNVPIHELGHLAITQSRQEFTHWTSKRLHQMTLGCYCYISAGEGKQKKYWHIIFIEPDLQPKSIEVTLAHELIHMADRVHGNPRKHHHHGYDSIAVDEAALTGYSMEELRALLSEEGQRREKALRERRPIRYIYECPSCGKQYPRTRRYSHPVSCSSCDTGYNPRFRLKMSNTEPA